MKTICNIKNRNKKYSAYVALVNKVYREDNIPQRYKGTTESMLREFFSKTSKKKYTWKRRTFRDLLLHVYNQKGYALLRNYNYVQALHNMSSFGNKLVRPIESWENNSINPNEQISSLIKHCFAKYEVPRFLENTFYGAESLYMLWYVQLGKGRSVKNLSSLPVNLTSKMAHILTNAPHYFLVNQALRYAQAKGFGATHQAAKVIAASELANVNSNHEEFWETVVRFFVKVECLACNEINHIVAYLKARYYEDNTFSMRGRTFNALLNHTNVWHRKKHFENANVLQWETSGIPPLYVEEELNGVNVVFKTIELNNSFELYEEGEAMSHCVAEYDDDCYAKHSAIFSLQKEVSGQPIERLATLEVGLPDMQIIEAKAKYNQEPCTDASRLIDNWVKTEAVKRYEAALEEPHQPVVYERAVEREQMRTQDLSITIKWIFRMIIIVLYLSFLTKRTSNYEPSPKFSFENELKFNSSKIDSILKASYKVNWPKDSIKINLKDIKWQSLNLSGRKIN